MATKGYANNPDSRFQNCTIECAENNLKKLKKYLLNQKIKTLYEWEHIADCKAQNTFIRCFDNAVPVFSSN